MPKILDLTGERFGRLTVIDCVGTDKRYHKKWKCRCDCGNEIIVLSTNLLTGQTKSCGCWRSDLAKENNTTHGGTGTRLFNAWQSMRDRCSNPNNKSFGRYGGRGITVCKEWDAYVAFRDWSLANGYSDALSIDRIDNDGNYEPSNCRWATPKQQGNNRGNNRILCYMGESHTTAEWSRILGIHHSTIHGRLNNGWSVDEALSTIPKKRRKQIRRRNNGSITQSDQQDFD